MTCLTYHEGGSKTDLLACNSVHFHACRYELVLCTKSNDSLSYNCNSHAPEKSSIGAYDNICRVQCYHEKSSEGGCCLVARSTIDILLLACCYVRLVHV